MGGPAADSAANGADILSPAAEGGGADASETLYLELREGAEPVSPLDWFAANED
jgi:septal ring factor EnvC (AmiA/AmiB activator)